MLSTKQIAEGIIDFSLSNPIIHASNNPDKQTTHSFILYQLIIIQLITIWFNNLDYNNHKLKQTGPKGYSLSTAQGHTVLYGLDPTIN